MTNIFPLESTLNWDKENQNGNEKEEFKFNKEVMFIRKKNLLHFFAFFCFPSLDAQPLRPDLIIFGNPHLHYGCIMNITLKKFPSLTRHPANSTFFLGPVRCRVTEGRL